MVDVNVVNAKLSELAMRIARVRGRLPGEGAVFGQDADALDVVAFNLMLAVQSCLDIASHLISDEGLPSAPTLAQSFARLRDHGVLSAPTAQALIGAAGLRNVLAHAYSAIDPVRLQRAASEGLVDLETFAREVAQWLAAR